MRRLQWYKCGAAYEVVALNIKVLGVVEINTIFTARAKCGIDRRVGKENRLALVGLGKLVAFCSF